MNNSLVPTKPYGDPNRHESTDAAHRSLGSHITIAATILVVAILGGALVMVLIEAIAEAQRSMSAAATGGLFHLIATVFFSTISLVANGSEFAYRGGVIGLYVGIAMALVYLLWVLTAAQGWQHPESS
jgi:hypothetical protein